MPIYYTGNVWRGGDSSVDEVTITTSEIYIQFRDRSGKTALYLYTKARLGSSPMDVMAILAEFGSGLNSYINRNRIFGNRV